MGPAVLIYHAVDTKIQAAKDCKPVLPYIYFKPKRYTSVENY